MQSVTPFRGLRAEHFKKMIKRGAAGQQALPKASKFFESWKTRDAGLKRSDYELIRDFYSASSAKERLVTFGGGGGGGGMHWFEARAVAFSEFLTSRSSRGRQRSKRVITKQLLQTMTMPEALGAAGNFE